MSDTGIVGRPSAAGAARTSGADGASPTAAADEQLRYSEIMAAMPDSVPALFLQRVADTPHREAYQAPDGAGGWRSISWSDASTAVTEIAAGLVDLGVQAQDPVAIAASTRIEWVMADLGIMCAGAATTTIYPTTSPSDVQFILADSGSRVVVAEDAAQLDKVVGQWSTLPDLVAVVVIDPAATAPGSAHAGDQRVLSLAELRGRGRDRLAAAPDTVRQRVDGVRPDHLATLMYTSGTTGRPKGVRLAHSCWLYEAAANAASGVLTPDDLQYLWLPLSHSFGKLLLVLQMPVGFATVVDGDLDRLVDNLGQVRPTFMAGAPRIFEKVHSRVRTQLESESGAKRRIADWAFGVGLKVSQKRQARQEPSGLLALQYRLADALVLSKVKEKFGGRVRYFVSGSAALSRDVAEWFHAAGILVLEGYGLTETSAGTFVNRPGAFRFGTVGMPFAGTEVRLADDGEIQVRGPGVMQGYHNLPEETAEVLSHDGWLSTGDIGEFVDGCLRITDRKKDLIKTSGGKYVAPQLIETQFKAVCPYASQIVVHGDGRNYVTALITLDADAMSTWAQANGLAGQRYEQVVTSPQARQMVAGYVDELNARLNRWETVKRFEVLPTELTVEDGSLTPSLKLKRRVVEKRYAGVLDGMYTG
ncbi:MAG TPA: long-chain fatty acid--CoA ligase [Actinomycetales bacterium]|nr:long-chain fatty acid--CoA ligase [Actinomycetales bacterium]